MPNRASMNAKPPIFVSQADYESLSRLALEACSSGAKLLSQELARATIVKDGETSPPFVRLNAHVEYQDLSTGRLRTVILVTPKEASMEENRLSVIEPTGAALLGLSVGDSFSWSIDGRPHVLVINRIVTAD